MTKVQVTVEMEGTKASAKARLEQAGFTVVRVTAKRADATITPRDRFMRASALIDMPEGLDPMEQKAYVAGYAKGCHAYVKRHGAPSLPISGHKLLPWATSDAGGHAGQVPDRQSDIGPGLRKDEKAALRLRTIDHEWDRHPTAHKAAMRALRVHQERHAAYQEALRMAS